MTCSARSTRSPASPGRSQPRRAISPPARMRPAQRRRLPHDPRVVRGVRGRGDERRELVQADAAPDVLELAALLQLVGQRDRVDRLALGVEREGGAVDLRVRLPVEVARVEDLAHGPDRARGEHHRPENRLLGFEVLGRDGGVVGDGSELGHAGVIPPRAGRCCHLSTSRVVNMSFCAICRGIAIARRGVGRCACGQIPPLAAGTSARSSTGGGKACGTETRGRLAAPSRSLYCSRSAASASARQSGSRLRSARPASASAGGSGSSARAAPRAPALRAAASGLGRLAAPRPPSPRARRRRAARRPRGRRASAPRRARPGRGRSAPGSGRSA